MADHPRPAADISFGKRSAACGIERLEGKLPRYRKTRDVAQPTIIGLGHDRKMKGLRSAVAHGERTNRVAHDAHGISIRDADRRADIALLGDPWEAGHLAVAVEGVPPGEDVVGPDLLAARPDRGDAGADDARRVADQRRVADADPFDVGDGVEGTRRQGADPDAEITQPRTRHHENPIAASDPAIV